MNTSNHNGHNGHPEDVPLDIAIENDPELRAKIGRHLGGVRRLRKISQSKAAKGIGVSRPHLSNVEQGKSKTDWIGLRDMAAYYELGIRQLIDEVRSPDYLEPEAGPMPAPAAVAGIGGPFVGYSAQNLTDYEKFVMSGFHILDASDRNDIMQQILTRLQRKLGRP